MNDDDRRAHLERCSSTARIVSGWEAAEGQIPWQLSLRMVDPTGAVSSCGGSVIHPEWGLTAAHCTATRVTMVLRCGAVSLWRPELIFETYEYFNHPLYIDALQSVVQPHDISLLKFQRTITFSDRVQPIRVQNSLDRNRNYDGVRLIASGWGRTWTNGATPENLQWVYLAGDSNQRCSSAFGGSSIIVDSTICASSYNVTSQSTCQGDSGGPLVDLEEDGKYTLVGVTSFVSALGCHAGMPAGFIRPGHYHDWITDVTGINFDWVPEPPTDSSESKSSESSESEEKSKSAESSEETSEAESNETPEAESNETPDAESNETPEVESNETSEAESNETPEAESDETPEAESNETPEAESNETPEAESNETPEAESNETPEAESNETPEAESNETPEAESNETPEAESNETPEAESNETSEAESGETPEAESNETPEAESNETPEAESNETPEAESNETPEAESNETPEAESNETPEAESNETPEAESNETPEAESNETPEAESDETPEAESNETPEAESNETPEAESEETSEEEQSRLFWSVFRGASLSAFGKY
ncbi:retinitis pigmentosa 1-like 1 protein [Cydia splendana]|uniref:retinitis pigmentosa 1-like 1 protein n=1 Tax=Cydia splendana TaxID=1100963 RepID=UPI00300CF43A